LHIQRTPQQIARIKANLEKDNNELIILELILAETEGIDSPVDFFMKKVSSHIRLGREEFVEIYYYFEDEFYYRTEFNRFFLNKNGKQRIDLLQKRKSISDAQETKERQHFDNEAKITKWQLKSFWWVFSLGLIAGIYSVIDLINTYVLDSDYIKKDEIELYIRELETKEKHENDMMGLHDLIYSDSTLLNKK
jgi:hypothetical protein